MVILALKSPLLYSGSLYAVFMNCKEKQKLENERVVITKNYGWRNLMYDQCCGPKFTANVG